MLWQMARKKRNDHWVGLEPDPKNYFGFVYLITDLTNGKAYIGKKQYYVVKSGVKGCTSKVSDRQSPKWKSKCYKESDWHYYKGSSPSLKKYMKENPDHNYRYEIIRNCRSRGTLHYAEVEAMVRYGVLWVTDDNGEHIFFNRQIPATRFRPPKYYATEEWAKETREWQEI